jgi:hypothetical protein
VKTGGISAKTTNNFKFTDWHHVVWSWSIGIYDTVSFSSLTINGVNQGFKSVNQAMPTDTRDTKLYFGDDSNSFSGSLVDIYVGRGGFHEPACKKNKK